MTPKEMHFHVKRVSSYAMAHGWRVDVNRTIPYVAVEGPELDDEHFFHGDEAVDLLVEADKTADVFDVYTHEAILWMAQGW